MKRTLSLILVLVIGLCLCACGSIEHYCEACGKPANYNTGRSYLCDTCKDTVFDVVDEALSQ